MRARGLALVVAITALGGGCGRGDALRELDLVSAGNAITERHIGAEITWNIRPDGAALARIRGKDGAWLTEGVTGTVTVKGPGGALSSEPLELDAEDRVWKRRAPIGALAQDLTEVSYEVTAEGNKLQGTLHVPRGGTKALVDGAEQASRNKAIPADGRGQRGGILQGIGDEIVEIIGDKQTGTVRVYVLGADLKSGPVGKRKARVALGGPQAEVIALEPDASEAFFVGRTANTAQPFKVTIVLGEGEGAKSALCRYVPGAAIAVGPAALGLPLFVAQAPGQPGATPPASGPKNQGKGGRFDWGADP